MELSTASELGRSFQNRPYAICEDVIVAIGDLGHLFSVFSEENCIFTHEIVYRQ
jgi:hypothetical protein